MITDTGLLFFPETLDGWFYSLPSGNPCDLSSWILCPEASQNQGGVTQLFPE
jgi:hypothetical protein